MTTPHPLTPQLAQMPALAELFRLFLSGKHLNRMAEPALWAELEQHEPAYAGLFAALGFELRVDARGFAWFHSTDASSNIGKVSRQLALLFMVIFDAQANAGKALQRFAERINTEDATLNAWVGLKLPGNDYYPVIVGEQSLLSDAKALKERALATRTVKDAYLSTGERR